MNKKDLNKIAKGYEWKLSQYVLDDIKNMQKMIEEYKRDNIDRTIQILKEIGIDTNTISEHDFLVWFHVQEMLSLKQVLTIVISNWQEYINCINDWIHEKTSSRDSDTEGHRTI